ncbi:MAG: TPM domain-containing protein [Bacteroidota bacterium]
MRRLPILVLLAACAAHAQPAVPALTGRVVDRAEVLDAATEQALADQLEAHEEATSNQVVVLTIPSLEGESVERLADEVFNTWGLGQADLDNGVLVLIARDDREMRIEVGYGLEGDLTDAQAGRIIRGDFVPAFRSGDYDGGTLAGVTSILGTIEGTYEPADGGGGSEDIPWFVRLIFGFTHVLIPAGIATMTLFTPGCVRYFTFLFFLAFIGVGSIFVFPMPYGFAVGPTFLVLWLAADIYMSRSPTWRAKREEVRERTKKGLKTKVSIGGLSFSVGGRSSSSGGASGGGFSGGGGSSGGGGASGSW